MITTLVIIAAGNEGASGAFTAGTPSVGHGPVSVASFDNNYFIAKQFTADGLGDKQSKYTNTCRLHKINLTYHLHSLFSK